MGLIYNKRAENNNIFKKQEFKTKRHRRTNAYTTSKIVYQCRRRLWKTGAAAPAVLLGSSPWRWVCLVS